MTGSRNSNQVYQNTTGRTIWVATNTGTSQKCEISPDNSTWFPVSGGNATAYFFVPDGWYYRNTGTFSFWTEFL